MPNPLEFFRKLRQSRITNGGYLPEFIVKGKFRNPKDREDYRNFLKSRRVQTMDGENFYLDNLPEAPKDIYLHIPSNGKYGGQYISTPDGPRQISLVQLQKLMEEGNNIKYIYDSEDINPYEITYSTK